MKILDENIAENQRQLLRSWRIPVRQIGLDVGRPGMTDDEIIPLLHSLSSVTFFSRDDDFYNRQLCHHNYCLVCMAVGQYEAASFVRRVLRHPALRIKAKRMGKVIRASRRGLLLWQHHADEEERLEWPP